MAAPPPNVVNLQALIQTLQAQVIVALQAVPPAAPATNAVQVAALQAAPPAAPATGAAAVVIFADTPPQHLSPPRGRGGGNMWGGVGERGRGGGERERRELLFLVTYFISPAFEATCTSGDGAGAKATGAVAGLLH